MRRRATHPEFESAGLHDYMKRDIEVNAGEKTTRKFKVKEGQTLHWQIWKGEGQFLPMKTQTMGDKPGLKVQEVTFRRATIPVPCYPIKTFEVDDWVVKTLKPGDVVRQIGKMWQDTDKRWKIQHSKRRPNPPRPLWSLQPDHMDDEDKYLRTIPDRLGEQVHKQSAIACD